MGDDDVGDGGDDAGEEEGNGKENDKIAHRVCGCCAWSSNPPSPSHPIPMRESLLLVPFHRWEKPSLERHSVVNCTWPHGGWWLSYQSAFQLLTWIVPLCQMAACSTFWVPGSLKFFVAIMIDFVLPNSLLTPGQVYSWKRWFSETLLKLRKSHRKHQLFTKYIPRVIQFPNPKSNTVINSPPVELRRLGRSQKPSREIEESIYASGLNFR